MILEQHRSHDYRYLMRCWRDLAVQAGLKMKPFVKADGQPVYVISSPETKGDTRETIYISAGVHGDEVAPPWGLLSWAEENIQLLLKERFLIFPTLNPHGMILNTRSDLRGVDLNRAFQDRTNPLIAAWHQLMQGRKVSMGLCLHEDYDGQGCYLYELPGKRVSTGNQILADCAKIMAVDGRKKIDISRATNGLIVRRVPPKLPGLPEAIVLFNMGANVTLTFETPSEFSLVDRVNAQKVFISSALKHVLSL